MALININLHNTLTGKKEALKPIHDMQVGIYTCGPTVYNYAHIGNLRAYVFADTLRRALEYAGYAVRHVMNITDVGEPTSDESEDKMAKGLRREGKPLTLEAMSELGEFYAKAFLNDLQALNIEFPHEMPRASRHIEQDVELVQMLLDKKIAYTTSDGIYFDISRFPLYGTRGGFALGELREGARIEINTEKRTPRDFALWKFSTGPIGWNAPFGRGFPGWHIECSAMSRKYLGQPFDIHTGGIDHIPTHHQNEIAQSEAAYGSPLAQVWMHNEHLNMGEAKMAKSGENFITLQTLTEHGIRPLSYRYYLLQAHYRSPVNFSWTALEAAQNAYVKLLYKFSRLDAGAGFRENPMREAILQAIGDDLNTSKLLSEMWLGLQDGGWNRNITLDCDRILGLDIVNQAKKLVEEIEAVPENIQRLAAAREEARQAKDFVKADLIREEIHSAGFDIMDTDTGPLVRKSLKH